MKLATVALALFAFTPGARAEVTTHPPSGLQFELPAGCLGPQLTDLEVDVDAETSQVNGLQQVYSAGTATLGGKPIQWDLTLVKGGQRVLAVLALGEDTGGVDKVRASIQRMRPMLKGNAASSNDEPVCVPDYDPPD